MTALAEKLATMQTDAGDYYQRASSLAAPRCCSGRLSQQQQQQQQQVAATMATGNTDRSLRISTTIRGAELLCCCCSCSTMTTAKSPGLVASLGVCLLVFGYTLLGAFAFMALEGGFKSSASLHQEIPSVTATSSATTGNAGSSSTTGPVNGGVVTNGKIDLSTGERVNERGGSILSNNSSAGVSSSGITSTSSETPSARTVPPSSLLQPNNHPDDIVIDDSSTRKLRAHTVERLWSITEDLNVLYKENWTRLAEQEVLELQEKMAQHSLDRVRSGSTIYGTTAVQRAGSTTVGRRNNDKRLPGVAPLMKQTRRRWTFGSSFLYSITLITTIGYGSISPRTIWGRLITIIYALAGIPLMLVYLSTVGDVLARTFRRLYGRICGRVECMRDGNRTVRGSCQSSSTATIGSTVPGIIGKTSYHRYDNHIDNKLSSAGTNVAHQQFYSSKSSSSDELGLIRSTGSGILLDCSGEAPSANSTFQEAHSGNSGSKRHHHHHFYPCSSQISEPTAVCLVRIPISLCLLIILLYICCGAVMFNRLEGWSLLEGSYFCFTSLGTIGFGDLVPSGGNASTHILEELSLCACSLYILAGMGLIAMCFNLMQDEVVRVVRVFGRTCGMSPMTNCNGTRIINNPPPPPPPPPSTTATATTGIKSDLSVHVERDFVGPTCPGSNANNDTRVGLGTQSYDRREVVDEEEAIAMSLVPNS